MSTKFSILAIDDQRINFDLIKLALKDKYNLTYMSSGKEALDKLEDIKPDLILLDIDMPDMNGYEVCKKVKSMSAPISETPIVFISAKDTLEERMEGYEAGGEDFIVKPFEATELVRKVQVSINIRDQREKLKADVATATNTAMTALTMSAELGIVINFLTNCSRCDNFKELGNSLLESLSQYGLNAAIQIIHKNHTVNLDTNKVTRPLEAAILSRMHDQGRIVDFGPRTVLNYEHISVLIKDMPILDKDKYGRYKDNLALIVEGAEARTKGIISETMVQKQETALLDLVDSTRSTLTEIDQKNHNNKIANSRIMGDLVTEVLDSFIGLDLSDYQEEKLLNIIKHSAEHAKALFDEGIDADDKISQIVKKIEKVLS